MKTQVMEDKPEQLVIFKKHAKTNWPHEWVEDHGAINYAEFSKIWKQYVLPLQSELSSAQEKNRKLLEALKDTVERMGRARGILTNMYGVHDSWQMLNAERYQELISEIENKKVCE